MKHLHEGWDYRLYKIYVWGGLALIVAHIFVAALVFDVLDLPGGRGFTVLLTPFLLWFAGVLLYWWWVFLFKGSRELKEWTQTPGQGVPDIKALESWSTLHQAMAIHGGDVKELIKNERRAKLPIILWYGATNLGAIWIIAPVTLGSLGIFQMDVGVWIGGAIVWVALMLVGTPFLVGWGGRGAQKAYLAPLELAVTRVPRLEADQIALLSGGQALIPKGPVVVEGERHGRLVHIETIGKHSLVVLQARVPEFEVQSDDGKLVPDEGAPEAVVKALKSLRKAKRWRGIVVHAGTEGLAVQRHSTGTNMWLYDLWLAEHLLNEISDSSDVSG